MLADKLERRLSALDDALKAVPRDTFDPRTIVESVGNDPLALFRWVREKTTLVPYCGVLRSTAGVLMDRLGNSLDRALLLHSLLTIAGHTARLAHGRLPDSQVAALLARPRTSRRQPDSQPGESGAKAESFLRDLARRHQLDEAELVHTSNRLASEQRAVFVRVSGRAERQAAEIFDRVRDLRLQNQAESAEREKALRDHWWVQQASGEGWIDLDPTWPDAAPGVALTTALATLVPDEIPVDLFHTVTIRVIVERLVAGRASESVALEHTIRPFELLGRRIVLWQVPMHWPETNAFAGAEDPVRALRDRLAAESEWLPVLAAGDHRITQWSIHESGNLHAAPGTGRERTGAAGGLAGGLFGAFAGEQTGRSSDEDSQFSAEWIECEITSPSRPPRKIRREVFDLTGPANRAAGIVPASPPNDEQRFERSLAMFRQLDLLLQPCDMDAEFLVHLLGQSLLSNRDTLLRLLRLERPADIGKGFQALGRLDPVPAPVYFLAAARHAANRAQTVYLDRPNILGYLHGLRAGSGASVTAYQGFDIVTNEVATWSADAEESFRDRLRHGVLDTNLETLGAGGCGAPMQNTSEQYDVSRGKGVAWIAVASSSDPAWRRIALPRDVRERLERALANGHVAIVPRDPERARGPTGIGWWRVDRRTGGVVGVGPHGEGQGMSETVLHIVDVVAVFFCLGHSVAEVGAKRLWTGAFLLLQCAMMVPMKVGFAVVTFDEASVAVRAFWAIMNIVLEGTVLLTTISDSVPLW